MADHVTQQGLVMGCTWRLGRASGAGSARTDAVYGLSAGFSAPASCFLEAFALGGPRPREVPRGRPLGDPREPPERHLGGAEPEGRCDADAPSRRAVP